MRKNPTQDGREQNINDVALEYMEHKYGEKFAYAAPWGDSLTGTRKFLATCGSLPGQKVLVQIDNFKKDNRVFRDNYLAMKYQDQTEAFLKECADTAFGETKVFYKAAVVALSADLSADASFEEFFADKEGYVSVGIAVREDSFLDKEQALKVTDAISSACGAQYLSIKLVVVEDSEYRHMDSDMLGDKVVNREFVHCVRLTRENGRAELEWLGED